METIFIISENSKASESHRFKLDFTDKLDLKHPKKHYTWTNIKSEYSNNKFRTPETMKLLGSTKKDVDKDRNDENVPKLESVEVVLMHCNLVKMIINTHQKFLVLLFQKTNLDS